MNCFPNRLKAPPTVQSVEVPEEGSLSLVDGEPQELGYYAKLDST